MAGTRYFLAELERVGGALESDTTVYLFGGGMMALAGLKAETKDLDLVVEGRPAGERLVRAFEQAGYRQKTALTPVYKKLHARAVLDNADGFRIDLFVDRICRALDFSPRMQGRARPLDVGAPRLDLRVAAPEDVLILKAVTDRPRDVDDMEAIAENPLDWGVIKQEMLAQRRTGGKFFMPVFIQSLEELQGERKVEVPIIAEMLQEVERDLDEIEAKLAREKAARSRKRALRK